MTGSNAKAVDKQATLDVENPDIACQKCALDFRAVFVVGSPRSGTTWVQLLLDQHPGVVTAPETQIFAYYLDHFQRQWDREHRDPVTNGQGKAGLSRLLSEAEFDHLCRSPAAAVLRRISRRDESADVVVEKSPQHALHVEWIHRLFPDAYFVHVIRDPRDTVASIMAAAESWGRGWAPRHPADAARMWRRNVSSARRGGAITERYRELYYEDLKRDAVGEVAALFDWLQLDANQELCQDAVEACRLDRLKKKGTQEERPLPGSRSPDGFFRKGEAGGWRDDLSQQEVRIVEQVCSEVMEDLDYRPTSSPGIGTALRIRVHDSLRRIKEALDWRFDRLLQRL